MILETQKISSLIDLSKFEEAFSKVNNLLSLINDNTKKDNNYFLLLSNIASLLVDIGGMNHNLEASQKGLELMEENEDKFIELRGRSTFYYNLGNAKSNFIKIDNSLDINNQSFYDIEQLVEVKSYLWKAIKFSFEDEGLPPPEYIVNLGNIFKRQFRLVEALECYDKVNKLNFDIPQSWTNKSESLILLNQISTTYTIQRLQQIKEGYAQAIISENTPPIWIKYYQEKIDYWSNQILETCNEEKIEIDDHETINEYNQLSQFRKFCLDNNLSLSEHGLYCKCVGSARDNLTIPTFSGVTGDFIVAMEMVLNRLKSEFSFARRLYYEYLMEETPNELQHESCFSELFNDEVLGLDVEKLRTSFRLCFGILDKIGVAICELYDVYPNKKDKKVYFQNLWQLNINDRREKFEKNKTAGLLALYSIATDLNDRKDGEWAFFKSWRNDLEHKFVVIHKNEEPSDVYRSYDFMDEIIFIKESEFVRYLEQLLQLTRSAIFSFVFMVRAEALKSKDEEGVYITNEILRQDNY